MMTVAAVEEFVLTDDMQDAIRAARFKTTNVPRTHCWIYDSDLALIRRVMQPFTEYQPAQIAEPGRVDYQISSGNPTVVAFVAELLNKGRSKPLHNPATAPIPF